MVKFFIIISDSQWNELEKQGPEVLCISNTYRNIVAFSYQAANIYFVGTQEVDGAWL